MAEAFENRPHLTPLQQGRIDVIGTRIAVIGKQHEIPEPTLALASRTILAAAERRVDQLVELDMHRDIAVTSRIMGRLGTMEEGDRDKLLEEAEAQARDLYGEDITDGQVHEMLVGMLLAPGGGVDVSGIMRQHNHAQRELIIGGLGENLSLKERIAVAGVLAYLYPEN